MSQCKTGKHLSGYSSDYTDAVGPSLDKIHIPARQSNIDQN